ncbi:FMN-dependent dehydrogenase, partial [Aureobasidium melanogenum]
MSSSSQVRDPITVSEIKTIAKERLDSAVWDYYTTAADRKHSACRNTLAFESLVLRPRVLRNVSVVDTSISVLGRRYDFPIAIAPTAYQKLAGGDGEIDVARAAYALGTNFILSTNATTSLEDVAAAIPTRNEQYPKPWFQLYLLGSRSVTAELIHRAEVAGYEALVLTVDSPVLGNRLHERKTPLQLPPGLTTANAKARRIGGISKAGLLLRAETATEAKRIASEHRDFLVDSTTTWDDVVPWLRAQTSLKIVLKGIMTAEDAQLAIDWGLDAIIVSNHGGRQLDGVSSTIEALPEVAATVKGKIPVIVDGGIEHGTDVFKAVALGADLCLIGRSALWGLAWDGQKGVEKVLNILERELSRTMALMGVSRMAEVSRDLLGRVRADDFGIAKL